MKKNIGLLIINTMGFRYETHTQTQIFLGVNVW